MAKVFLFQPADIGGPQWSKEKIESVYGPLNLYSFYSDSFWVGARDFGEAIDYRYDGIGLREGTDAGRMTGVAGYIDGIPTFSVSEFNIAISDVVNFTPGLPISQLGIFDGSDYMSGSDGGDVLEGLRGADEIWGAGGDDLIRAGNGGDIIWGAEGSDVLYGGFGRNTFKWEDDGSIDQIFLKSDQFAYNYIYSKSGNSPNGEKADLIYGLDSFDRIYIQGVSTGDLSFYESGGNIEILAKGYLEAVYTGGNLSVDQLKSMTAGIAA